MNGGDDDGERLSSWRKEYYLCLFGLTRKYQEKESKKYYAKNDASIILLAIVSDKNKVSIHTKSRSIPKKGI